MEILALFTCWLLGMTCTATPPVIVHRVPTEFTIESVKVGAVSSPQELKPQIVSKSKATGGMAGKVLTTEQKLAQEEPVFAHINPSTSVADAVIVISQETLDQAGGWELSIDGTNRFYPKEEFVRTSSKGTVRKNYAGIGYTYDKDLDAFIPPKPVGATIFDEAKGSWILPTKPCWAATTTPCEKIQ